MKINLKWCSILLLILFFFVVLSNVSATDVDSITEMNKEIQAGNTNITLVDNITIIDDDIKDIGDEGIIINHNVTINGHACYIDANHLTRIFKIKDGGILKLINITLINGQADFGGVIYCDGTLKINNSKFINNQANRGGAIYNNGALVIRDSTFNNNQAKYEGGAITNNGDSFTIINSTFTNNQANDNNSTGGAISTSNCNNFTIINSIFNNNRVEKNGGAIYSNRCNYFTIINSNFNNNIADEYTRSSGGAISTSNCNNFTIINSTFTNNQVIYEGGAIFTSNCNNFTIINSTFTYNSAKYDGGAIYNELNKIFTVIDSIFNNNRVEKNGGAIFTSNCNNFTIINSLFNENNASEYYNKGGAIYNKQNNIFTIINSKFNGNTASNYKSSGGAIYNEQNNIFTIINSNFTNNKAGSESGGAIYNKQNNIFTIINSKFNNNQADNDGGAIFTTSKNCTVINSKFTNNLANNYRGGGAASGGAICIYNCNNFTIIDSRFSNNQAKHDGGAIYSNIGKYFTVINSTFQENIVLSPNYSPIAPRLGYGGAISNKDYKNVKIINSRFSSNQAGNSGGAIYSYSYKNLEIIDSVFKNNLVDEMGGAIYSEPPFGDYDSTVKVINSTFNNNAAKYFREMFDKYGGAIYNNRGNLKVINSTFNDNQASGNGGVISTYNCNNVTIINSIFESNKAGQKGGAIYNEDIRHGYNFIVINSFFYNNEAYREGGVIYNNNINDFTVINSRFNNNFATSGGGVIYNNNINDFTVINSTFNNNTAKYEGGVIYNNNINDFTVINSRFNNNFATSGGGVIYNNINDFTVINSTFNNNLAKTGAGGVIYNLHGNLTIHNAIFENNTAGGNGGIIYNTDDECNLTIKDSVFNNNIANWDGGVIFNQKCYMCSVINSTFNGNRAKDCGGTIYSKGKTFTISDSNFNNSYASMHGGVIYNKCTDFTILDSNFTNNHAYEDGGAICNMGENLNILGSVFVNNYVSGAKIRYCEGGAIFSGYKMNCIDSFFMNNRAEDGGAIYCEATLTLKNCTFINNRAEKAVHACEGGAVNCNRLKECCNCTFIANHAENGGAIAIIEKSTTLIKDSVFINNTATAKTIRNGKGGAIFVNKIKSHISIIHNQFINNNAKFKGNNVYNWGHYDTIEYNYFPNENQNTFREYKVFKDKYHKDKHPYYNLDDYYNHGKSGSFTDLARLINESKTGMIVLDKNYTFNKEYDSAYINGITINKKITIIGNGFTINGCNISKIIFNININGDLTIKDVKLRNVNEIIQNKGNLTINNIITDNAYITNNGFINNNVDITVLTNTTVFNLNDTVLLTANVTVNGILIHEGNLTYNVNNHIVNSLFNKNTGLFEAKYVIDFTGTRNVTANYMYAANCNVIPATIIVNNKTGTFADLARLINESKTGMIVLDKNYIFNKEYDSAYINGIIINKKITIDGKRHILDGGKQARIFYITPTGNLTLKNITLKNGHNNGSGGAIYNNGGLIITDSIFNNNTAECDGGAIFLMGSDGLVNNVSFNGNVADVGSAIAVVLSTLSINNCVGDDTQLIYTDESRIANATLVVLNNGVLKTRVNETVNITAELIAGGLYVVCSYNDSVNDKVNLTVDGYAPSNANNCGNGFYWTKFKVDFINGTKTVMGSVSSVINLKVLNGFISTTSSSIITEDLVKYYHNASQFEAVLFDEKGNPAVGVGALLTICNKTYIRVSDFNGVARLNINLLPGIYTITTKNPLTGESVNNIVTVKSVLVDNKDIVMYYHDGSAYTVRLLDGQGHPFAGQIVNIKIHGVVYHRTTDFNGVARLNINLNPGNYHISAEYDGCRVSNIVTVKSVLVDNKTSDENLTNNSLNAGESIKLLNSGNPLILFLLSIFTLIVFNIKRKII